MWMTYLMNILRYARSELQIIMNKMEYNNKTAAYSLNNTVRAKSTNVPKYKVAK